MQEVRMGDGELIVHRNEEAEREFWLERHWSWLVVGFGLILVVSINAWHPTW